MDIPKLTTDLTSVIRSHFQNKKYHSYFEIQKEFDFIWKEAIKHVCVDWWGNHENLKIDKFLSPSVLPFVHCAKSPWYKSIIGIKGYAYLDLNGVEELTCTWLTAVHKMRQSSSDVNVSKSDSNEYVLLQTEITKLINDNAKANGIIQSLKEEISKQGNSQETQLNNQNGTDREKQLIHLIHLIYADLYKISSKGRSESDILLVQHTLSEVGLTLVEYQPGSNDELFTIKSVDYIKEQYMEVPTIIDTESSEVICRGVVYSPK